MSAKSAASGAPGESAQIGAARNGPAAAPPTFYAAGADARGGCATGAGRQQHHHHHHQQQQQQLPSSFTVAGKNCPTVPRMEFNSYVATSSDIVRPLPVPMTNSNSVVKVAKHGNGLTSSSGTNFLPASSSGPSPKYASSGVVSDDHSSHVARKPAPDGWRRSSDTALMNTRSSGCYLYPPAPINSRGTSSPPPAAADLTVSNSYGYCQYVGAKKPCHQRSVSGYQFCIRHILKDNSAPYRSCAYVKLHNGKECRCRNAVLTSQKDPYCGTHLVTLGLKEPNKRSRKLAPERCSVPCIAEVGVKVPYFPGLDISKGDVGFAMSASPDCVGGQSTSPMQQHQLVVNGSGPPSKVFRGEADRPIVTTNNNGSTVFGSCPNSSTATFLPTTNGWDSSGSDSLRKMVVKRDFSSTGLPVAACATSPSAVESRPLTTINCVQPVVAAAVATRSAHKSPSVSAVKEEAKGEQAPTMGSVRQKRHISLRPKRKSCLSMGLHRHIPAVGRMCHLLEEISFYQSDLFPLGLEPSDGEDEDEDKVAGGVGPCSLDIHGLRACTSKSFNSVDLKLYVACRTLELQIKEWQVKAAITSNVLNACAAFPDVTAAVLEEKRDRRPWPKVNSSLVRPCQYQILKEEGRQQPTLSPSSSNVSPMLIDMLQSTERRRTCDAPCLPYSSRCLQHVVDDDSQHLYVACPEVNCAFDKEGGFQLSCLSHKKDAATTASAVVVVEPMSSSSSSASSSSASSSSSTPSPVVHSTVKHLDGLNSTTDGGRPSKEESSHDAQLSFASAVQDLGIEVSEVSEMLSSLPSLCSFSGLLDNEFVRPEEATLCRESLPAVDQTYMSAADHNWADVEQFLLSEGYKANFSVMSSSSSSAAAAAGNAAGGGGQTPSTGGGDPLWAHCSGAEDAIAGAYTMYDSTGGGGRPCDVYACNGVQNRYEPFISLTPVAAAAAAAGPQQVPDVHLIYTASCDQYYVNNLADNGNNRSGGYVGSRRFDSQ